MVGMEFLNLVISYVRVADVECVTNNRVDSRYLLDSFFFQAEDGIRDYKVTGVQTCALPILFANDDPRLRYFFFRQNATAGLNNSTNSNGYYGRNPGDGTSVPANQTRRATFGIYPAGGLYDNAPINNLTAANIYLANTGATGTNKTVTVLDGSGAGLMPMITFAMMNFTRAEAALTLNTGENARQLFIDAITANLNSISAFAAANGGVAMPASTIAGYAA